MTQMAVGSSSPRLFLAPLAVLSPGPRLAGTPSRGNGNEGLKRLERFPGSGVCRQPFARGMPVVGALSPAFRPLKWRKRQRMAAGGSSWEGLHRSLAARDASGNEFLKGLRPWAEAGRHAPKGDEMYEARDLRIVLVDSPAPKSEPTFGGSPGLKAVFMLVSRRP
jgi:hypothetical protein